jgi:serine/threonine protein kinase
MSDTNADEEAKTVELQIDDVVDGRYRINRRLGRGGMGTVYESQQIKLQRQVALKVLRPEFASKELAAKRFEREAKAASSIDHRNVVKILDFGHLETGELYYTMELLQGQDLSQVLREHGALPWSRAGWIILQVVRAFAAIHDKGIVHRDIKPANCFLLAPKPGDDPDFVKILDFGIANLQDQDKATALTAASDIIGSVRYMAPEQAAADHVDARTDIYSLGIMMYELLTGQVPFRETNVFKVMVQHQQEVPRPPRELVPEIPPEVEAIILRAIAKQPDARFQSMGEIEAELIPYVELVAGSGVLQRTSPLGDPSASISAFASASASSSSRSAAYTSPGPTGTVAMSSGSVGTGSTLGRGADTAQRIGGSLAFTTPSQPESRRGRLVVFAVLVFAAAICATIWLKQRREGEAVATAETTEGKEVPAKAGTDEPPAEEEEPLRLLAPPPEEQYDPFADPFGAPPLRGRTAPRPAADGAAGAEDSGIPAEAVPLEELLPAEPWTLEVGSITGRLLNDKERPLAKGGQVCAWLVDPRAPAELRRRPKCGKADRQGRFEIAEVVPGFYDVHAFAQGFLPQSSMARDGHPLTVQPEQRLAGLELTLMPGGVEARGTVKTKLGDPVKGAKVAVVGAVRVLTTTDATGAFTLWVAEDAAGVSVVAWAEGYTDVVARGRASEPFALVLSRESILLGRVVDPESKEPIARARVRAGAKSGVDPLVYTNAEGEFEIKALSPGTYEPSARTDDAYGRAKKPVKLVEGTLSAEVVIEAKRWVAPKPVEPAKVEPIVADAGGSGGTEGSDGSTGGTDDTDGTGNDDGDTGEETSGAAPPPADPVPPVAPPVGPTDRSLRKAFATKLKSCGKDGTIEVEAKFVLQNGTLFKPKVTVTGAAAKDPAVKACAEKRANALKLLRRSEPESFDTMVVKI